MASLRFQHTQRCLENFGVVVLSCAGFFLFHKLLLVGKLLGVLVVLEQDFLGEGNIILIQRLQRKLELLERTELRRRLLLSRGCRHFLVTQTPRLNRLPPLLDWRDLVWGLWLLRGG